MKRSFLFISCDEAKHICDKVQYNEASGWERFKLGLRLFYCRITKRYSNKNVKLSQAIQKSQVKCLESKERIKLQQQLDEALAKKK